MNQKEQNNASPLGAKTDARPFYRTPAFRATAFAQSLVAVGGLHAQSNSDVSTSKGTLQLEDTTLVGDKLPELSSPKFTAPLRDTPKTVNVIPDALMDQQQSISLRDVLRNSPGITFQAGEGGSNPGDNLFIRGFSAEGDIFVNGVRDNAQYSRDVYNLEQVEVSKGPSSSVAGRGSAGGAVNLVTKTPFVGDATQVSAALGTDDYKRVTVDSNVTLDRETGSAVRVNAMWTDLEVPGRDGVTKSSWAVNPTFARELGENTVLNFGYQHYEQDNIPDNGLWRDAATDPNYDWTAFYGLYQRDYEKVESDNLNAEISSELPNGLTLRNYTHYNDSSLDYVVTSPRLDRTDPTLASRSDVKQKDRAFDTFTNDLSIRGEFGSDAVRHSFAAGLEYTKEGYTNFGRFHEGDAPTTELYNPTPTDTYDYQVGRTGAYDDTDADTIALYAFDTVELNERWGINAGLRWERFDAKQRSYDENGLLADTLARDDTMLSWNAGIVYKPQENGSVYFGYGTSFSPSAEDLTLSRAGRRGPSANHPDLEPEESRNMELGTKWDLAHGRLSLTGALFRTEKTNARTRTSSDELFVLDGEHVVEGVEIGISGLLTERWSAYGGFSLLDSEVTSSLDPVEEGHELPYAPSKSLNLWTTYQATDRFSFGAGAQYTGDYYYSTTSDESTIPPQADYWLVDFMASFRVNENLNLQFNVKNVTDEQYIERGYGGHFTPGAARSAILSANYQF